MSNRIKKKQEVKNSFEENISLIMGIFALVVFCVFPLVFHRYYFDILETKYQFYCVAAIVMIVVMAGYGLGSGRMLAYIRSVKIKEVCKSMSFVDWAMLAFWLSNVLSWIFCYEWRWEAFWGTSGRYNGVFLMTIYMVVYFIVSRFSNFKQWYLDAFLAVGIFVCVFGITDYFQMDILGFKKNMVETQKSIYTSTLGNINTYTVYVGAIMAVAMLLFSQEKNPKRMLWYYGNVILSAFALIMGTSDNAYLTLAALFGFAPLYLFRTKTGVRRYLISVATLLTVIQCIDWINVVYADTVWGIDSVFSLIADLRIFPFLVIGLWVITGGIAIMNFKKPREDKPDEIGRWLRYAWIGLIVLVAAVIVYVLFDANVAGNAEKYGAVSSYVVFNDSWGTNRGYVWRRSMEIYNTRFNLLQKLFGYGADTFRIPMQYYYGGQKIGDQFIIYDSAHNEYLHYLITIGLAGAVSYIAFMGGAIFKMHKTMKDRPEVAAVMFVVVAYMVQAIVNINLPIAMPIILQLLAMGVSKGADKN